MGIRTKTLVLMTVVVVVLGSGINLINAFASRRAAHDTERSEVNSNLERTSAALSAGIDSLKSITGDWSVWDDTYRFVHDRNEAYIDSNLQDDALRTLGVDFMVFTDVRGRIVYEKALEPNTMKRVPLWSGLRTYIDSQPSLLHQTRAGNSIGGIILLPEGPVAIVAGTIVTSDRKSPVGGTLLTGYFIRQPEVEAIRKLTLVPLKISAVDPKVGSQDGPTMRRLLSGEPTVVVPRNSQVVDGFTLFGGVDRQPALLLRVTMPRMAVAAANLGVRRSASAVLLLIVGLIGALGVVIDRNVLSRLSSLSADVEVIGRSADPTARVPVTGTDEIAVVARSVNTTLAHLEHSMYLATHDALTGLYNRQHFEEVMERDLAETLRLGGRGSVLWLDLDHFKEVNDSLGHGVGDQLLLQFGRLLRNETRSYGVVARLGGDEFGVLLPHSDEDQSEQVAQRLLTALSAHLFEIDGRILRANASMGVVTYPSQGQRVDEILARADLAMYAAKDSGRNCVSVYCEGDDTQQRMAARIEGAEQIRSAIQQGRLVLHAMPTVNLKDGTQGSCELLVRMVAEDGTIVFPDDFIPIAEHLGIVRDIDRWVTRAAIAMLAAEQEAGRDTLFSMNLSGLAFSDSELLTIVRTELDRTGARPSNLIFEITETAAIKDIHKARMFMEALRALGCRFSLDDFGSGMSSFYYLKQLPLDFLKIDGTLVQNLDVSDEDAYFVRAIVEMCRGLGIPTVAEYVETEGVMQILREMGVDYAQGFYVAKPGPWSPEPTSDAGQPTRH